MKCPECKKGEIVEKKARRRGTTFYGCTNYPKCKFTSANRPLDEKCPNGDSDYLVQKTLKEGPVIACPECDYKRPDPTRPTEGAPKEPHAVA